MSDSLCPHELQHASLPCPSPSPGLCSNSCTLSQWCHPAISSSVNPFSSCPQYFPTSVSFPISLPLIAQYVKNLPAMQEDPGLIPGVGRSPGEGLDYPLQYSWTSFVAQQVKNRPAMWEIWVPSLNWEDPLEKGMATHSSVLAWRKFHGLCSPWGRKEWDLTERLSLSFSSHQAAKILELQLQRQSFQWIFRVDFL